jgi:hypothetical protein
MWKLLYGCTKSIPLHLSVCFVMLVSENRHWSSTSVFWTLASMLTMMVTEINRSGGFKCHSKSNTWVFCVMSCGSPSQLLAGQRVSSSTSMKNNIEAKTF